MNSVFNNRYCIAYYDLSGNYIDNNFRSTKDEAINTAEEYLLYSFHKWGEAGKMNAKVFNELKYKTEKEIEININDLI